MISRFQNIEAAINPQSSHIDGDIASMLSAHRPVTDHRGTALGGIQCTHRSSHRLRKWDKLLSIPP